EQLDVSAVRDMNRHVRSGIHICVSRPEGIEVGLAASYRNRPADILPSAVVLELHHMAAETFCQPLRGRPLPGFAAEAEAFGTSTGCVRRLETAVRDQVPQHIR